VVQVPPPLLIFIFSEDYLDSKGVKIQKYVTVKPDIIFQIGKKKYATEIETGSVLIKVRK